MEHLNTLIRSASLLDAAALPRQARAVLDNLLGYLMADPGILREAETVATRISELADALSELPGRPAEAARANARGAAQAALDDLAEVMAARARPNDVACALGIGW